MGAHAPQSRGASKIVTRSSKQKPPLAPARGFFFCSCSQKGTDDAFRTGNPQISTSLLFRILRRPYRLCLKGRRIRNKMSDESTGKPLQDDPDEEQPVYAGGAFLVMDDSHPDVKLTDIVAQGAENMK